MTSTWFLMLPFSGLAPPSGAMNTLPALCFLLLTYPSISSSVTLFSPFKTPSLPVTWGFFPFFGVGEEGILTVLC